MSDGFIPQGIMPVSGGFDVKPNVAVQPDDALAASSAAEAAAKTDISSIGDMQLRKISPFEPAVSVSSGPVGPSVRGLSFSEQSSAGTIFTRLTSLFSLPQGNAHGSASSIAPDGGEASPKTAKALGEFEKMQQTTVGYALLSSLTQSVLSSVKRLTQGQ